MTKEEKLERVMMSYEAVSLLEGALHRIKKKPPNHSGNGWQAGGAYWRIAKVLRYLDKELERQEGKKHAEFLRKTHGVLMNIEALEDVKKVTP